MDLPVLCELAVTIRLQTADFRAVRSKLPAWGIDFIYEEELGTARTASGELPIRRGNITGETPVCMHDTGTDNPEQVKDIILAVTGEPGESAEDLQRISGLYEYKEQLQKVAEDR